MANLPTRYNWGISIKNQNATLYNQLSDTYSDTARAVNSKINKYISTSDPKANSVENTIFDLGDIWVNKNTDTAWIMTSRQTNTQVTWKQIT